MSHGKIWTRENLKSGWAYFGRDTIPVGLIRYFILSVTAVLLAIIAVLCWPLARQFGTPWNTALYLASAFIVIYLAYDFIGYIVHLGAVRAAENNPIMPMEDELAAMTRAERRRLQKERRKK